MGGGFSSVRYYKLSLVQWMCVWGGGGASVAFAIKNCPSDSGWVSVCVCGGGGT